MATRPKAEGGRPSARKVPPVSELPVTRAMLVGVRDELLARVDQVGAQVAEVNARLDQVGAQVAEINARVDQVGARFDQVDARFDQVDARFDQVDARFDQVHARIEAQGARTEAAIAELRAQILRNATLAEEQEARNRVVVEAMQGHNARFERIEASIEEMRELLQEVVRAVVKRPRE